jgi:hypothetical protein
MKQIGQMYESDGRYEFRLDEKALIVRGEHPEWVLQAAGEVLSKTAELEAESLVSELESLVEFEAATEVEVDTAKFQMKERFGTLPQCIVSLGKFDYKWAAPEARAKLSDQFDGNPIARIHDISLRLKDDFLENEDGVNTAG